MSLSVVTNILRRTIMKKTLVVIGLLFGFSLAAPRALHAQDASDASSMPAQNRMAEMLGTRLALSDVQKGQIAPILQDRQAKVKEILQDTSMRPMQKKRAAGKVRDESDKQIKAILTPDQFKQYKVLEEEMQEQMKEKMKERKAATN
jgi:hypothetical protein